MVLNVLALGAQLVLAGWLLRVLGLHRTMWVLPAFVFLGAAGVALGGGLLAALLLKGADGTLRYSLHRTGTELLFVPLPDSLRSRAKPVIDVVGQRGGQALASLLILAEITQNRGNTVLAVAAAALCVVWIAWAADLKGHYLNLFRAALREGALRARDDLPALDLGSLETLFSALNSRDDAEVIGAMELLAAGGRTRLIPALVLFHPSRDGRPPRPGGLHGGRTHRFRLRGRPAARPRGPAGARGRVARAHRRRTRTRRCCAATPPTRMPWCERRRWSGSSPGAG